LSTLRATGEPPANGTSVRVLPSWGRPLSESDYTTLESSWITREIADEAMLRRVDAIEGREVIGQKGNRDCAGMLIPYYWPDQPYVFNYRLRRDLPLSRDIRGLFDPMATTVSVVWVVGVSRTAAFSAGDRRRGSSRRDGGGDPRRRFSEWPIRSPSAPATLVGWATS
jgi:hypothetical protein